MKSTQEADPYTFDAWVSGTTIREAATAARASRIEQLIADGHDFVELIDHG